MNPSEQVDRKQLRRELRARRRALGAGERRLAERRFARNLRRELGPRQARHVAIYHVADGKVSPLPGRAQRRFKGTRLYLPVLDPVYRGRLRFHLWRREKRLRANRFVIGEPRRVERARADWALDVLDRKSTRLNSSHVKISYAVFFLKNKKAIISQQL